MKTFKSLLVSIDFSTKFSIISLASVVSAPEPPTNDKFQKFLHFPLKFRVNFDKILKTFQKVAKFPLKFSNKV